ncbi:putative 3',5'-cyclic-nucleotide phosphodiesterase regA [Blattamonas nauphoetae]|uniref:3',5'-cyclic-nucleotide phosphodiesterase regA n=1 Tax=Blattamonas nauphoetae TaxID=2049346 RepID=A0ABQ9WYR1_9EUKA|nr:putative 3',5'-cyclic-nucleotide phosphodiesterase regA [Blattamonas nauphoetae]
MSAPRTASPLRSPNPDIFKLPILIVGLEKLTTQVVANILTQSYTVTCAMNEDEANQVLATQDIQIVFVPLVFQEKSGLDFMDEIHQSFPELFVIIVSMNEGIDSMNRAYKRGATDVFQVPISTDMVKARVNTLLEHSVLRRQTKSLSQAHDLALHERKNDNESFSELVGQIDDLQKELDRSLDELTALQGKLQKKDSELAKEREKTANFAKLVMGAFSAKPDGKPQPAEVTLMQLVENVPEKVVKDARDVTQKITRAAETPIQALTRNIGEIVRGDKQMKPQDLKKALMQMVTSLSAEDLYQPQFQKLFKECGVDDMTRQWILEEFSTKQKQVRDEGAHSHEAVNVVHVGDTSMLKEWSFNPFYFQEDALFSFIELMFNEFGLLSRFRVEPSTFRDFVHQLRHAHADIPYHSFLHSFDCCQTAFLFLTKTDITKYLTPLDIFGILIATLCQDIDHPGLNNLYQVNAQTPLALTYNDISVLENFHATRCFALLSRTGMLKNLSPAEYVELRRNIITGILSTDMSSHFTLLTRLATHIETKPFSRQNPEDRQLLFSVIVHAVDLSNTTKPWHLCKKWCELMQEEFVRQGDVEIEHDLPRSPYMVRSAENLSKMMLNMIDYCVFPLYQSLCRLFPTLQPCLANIQANRLQFMQGNSDTRIPEIPLEDTIYFAGDPNRDGTEDEDDTPTQLTNFSSQPLSLSPKLSTATLADSPTDRPKQKASGSRRNSTMIVNVNTSSDGKRSPLESPQQKQLVESNLFQMNVSPSMGKDSLIQAGTPTTHRSSPAVTKKTRPGVITVSPAQPHTGFHTPSPQSTTPEPKPKRVGSSRGGVRIVMTKKKE